MKYIILKVMFKFFLYILLYICFINNIEATEISSKIKQDINKNIKQVDMFNPLKQTPDAILKDNVSKPLNFNKSNNLTYISGSFYRAYGELLYIKGKVTDAFGVPIHNAMIKIWQTNAAGKYQTIITKKNKYYDKNFLTSGQATTDNLGNYNFITVFPGFYDDRAPHINIIIIHEKFGMIETEIYFNNHPKNIKDPVYQSYNLEDRTTLTAETYYVNEKNHNEGKIVIFNVILDGIHEYKKH